ncbi:hypothetical protein BB560_001686 [Smittium megazygosporum]|uniref:Uncharacterized protein n=1 Tax=Smittium megazygosporum TaxID=133381 RepID=A0A2T9ZGS2_9FUNG|nr:hypothetical protein BB560_001686 [Smittium megazygosporum]
MFLLDIVEEDNLKTKDNSDMVKEHPGTKYPEKMKSQISGGKSTDYLKNVNETSYITNIIESSDDDELLNQIAERFENKRKRVNKESNSKLKNEVEKKKLLIDKEDEEHSLSNPFNIQQNKSIQSGNELSGNETFDSTISSINLDDPIAGSTEETVSELKKMETEFISLISEGVELIKEFDKVIDKNKELLQNESQKLDTKIESLQEKLKAIKDGASNLLGLA